MLGKLLFAILTLAVIFTSRGAPPPSYPLPRGRPLCGQRHKNGALPWVIPFKALHQEGVVCVGTLVPNEAIAPTKTDLVITSPKCEITVKTDNLVATLADGSHATVVRNHSFVPDFIKAVLKTGLKLVKLQRLVELTHDGNQPLCLPQPNQIPPHEGFTYEPDEAGDFDEVKASVITDATGAEDEQTHHCMQNPTFCVITFRWLKEGTPYYSYTNRGYTLWAVHEVDLSPHHFTRVYRGLTQIQVEFYKASLE